MEATTRRGLALGAAVVAVLAALLAVGVGLGGPAADEPQAVTVADLAEEPDRYLGERVVVEGWYQGGLLRDANPLCANTREGLQREPYSYVFVDVRTDVTLVTGVEYRFVGTLRDTDAVDKPTAGADAILVVEGVEELGRNPGECQFVPDATATPG